MTFSLRAALSSSLLRRYVILIVGWLLACSLNMGGAGLWDPWETHYGEVARNIITRGDPMDLRYKPGYGPDGLRENQFRSKHALPFWGMAAGMWVLDSGDRPQDDEMVASSRPLWALRLPSMLMAMWGIGALAFALHRCVSWQAGWLTAFVLATMPQFLMMARQATTDVYALGPMCVALGAWIQARYGEELPLQRKRVGRWSLPWGVDVLAHCWGWLLMIAVPIGLLWQHVTKARIIEMVADWPKRATLPDVQDLESIAQVMLIYGVAALLLLVWSLRAKQRSELKIYTVYMAGGWALMGKGMLVPGLLGLLFMVDLWRQGELLAIRKLKPIAGLALFALACVPWHHAMGIFRGDPWIHELLIENNLERFLSGEQAQAVGDLSYYLSVLLFAGGVWIFIWPRLFNAPKSHPVFGFAHLGAALSLAVISVSATKYDHYAAVTLPFLAIAVAGWLSQPIEASKPWDQGAKARLLEALCVAFVGMWVVYYLLGEPAKMVHLTTYLSTGIWRDGAGDILPYALSLCFAAALRVACLLRPERVQAWFRPAFLALAMANAWILMLQYVPESSNTWSQAGVMRSYFEQRKSGDELASWWFYHRGETFYSKRRVWVQASPDPKVLRDKIREMQAKPGDLWILTNPLHEDRLRAHLPRALRDKLTRIDARPQQVLLHLPLKETG